jgi:hypothetical protein
MLIRKSKWLFLLITLKNILFLLLSIWAVLFFSDLLHRNIEELKIVSIIIVYLVLFISFFGIIISLVSYFYAVTIVTWKSIYRLRLWLLFFEDIDAIDLYRIQEIKAHKEWFLDVLLNVGNLHLVDQKDREIIIHFIDKPEEVVKILEWLKEKLVQERFNKKEEI